MFFGGMWRVGEKKGGDGLSHDYRGHPNGERLRYTWYWDWEPK